MQIAPANERERKKNIKDDNGASWQQRNAVQGGQGLTLMENMLQRKRPKKMKDCHVKDSPG